MNLLSSTYVFYADVYFVQNFIIKAMVIYLSLFCNKCFYVIETGKGMGKLFLVSGLGTLMEVLGLVLGNSYQLFVFLIHLFEIPCMIRFMLGKERKYMLRVIIMGYFFVVVINGVLEILWNWLGNQRYYVFYLCTACGVVYIGTRMWLNYQKMCKGIFTVELCQSGCVLSISALYDSGNNLKDPYTGKGVHIISERAIPYSLTEGEKEVYIPYQSLGNEQGLLKIYYVEYIRIQKEHEMIEICDVPIGVAQETLFADKKYQMILNEEIA